MKNFFLPILLLFSVQLVQAQYNVSINVSQVQVTGFCDEDGVFNGDSDAQWGLTVSDNRTYSENFDHEVTSNGPTVTVTSGFDNPLNYNFTYTDICPPNFLLFDFEGCDDDNFGVCSTADDLDVFGSLNVDVPMTAGSSTNVYDISVGGCGGTVTYFFTVNMTTTGTPDYICADEPCMADVQSIQDGCTTTNIFDTRYDVSNSTSTFPSSLFGCGGNNDIFFEFVAPNSGEIIINMSEFNDFGSLTTLTDLTMNLMEGASCSSLTSVDAETYSSSDVTNASADCINMSGGLFNDNYSPIYLQNLTVGQTYYIRVTEDDDQNAYMDLSFQAIVENDFCINAIELTGTDSYTACNFNATDRDEPDISSWVGAAHTGTFAGGPVQTCSGWSSNENMVWYYFTVDSNTPQPISITAENANCVGGASTLQLGVWYQGAADECDIANHTGVGCAVGVGDLTVTLPDNVPNGTYYVAMDGNAGALCTWEFTSDQILPVCPRNATATSSANAICSGGSVAIDLQYATAGFGGATGLFDLSSTPSTGVSYSSGPLNVAGNSMETITFPANMSCAPIEYTLSFNAKCSNGDDIIDPANITITVYPEILTAVVVDDGTTCGTPMVELRAADGTVCESQSGIGSGSTATGSCSDGGDALNYDFNNSPTVLALATAPTACAQPSFAGTIACTACCSIVNITAGAQTPCDPSTDTYDQDIIITFTGAPASGSLNVNGTLFPIGSSPMTVTLTNPADGSTGINVTAFFTAAASCTLTIPNLFGSPSTCVSCTDGIQNGLETGLDCGGPNCPACPVCFVSQYYSGVLFSGIYQTSSTIGANAIILNTDDVSLLASCINLDAGFETQLGAEFLADPVPCTTLAPTDSPNSALQEDIYSNVIVSTEGVVSLNYYLPQNSPVQLKIQSLNGVFEQILFDESQKLKGEHLVQITPENLKSGVYLVTIKHHKGERMERIVIP